MNKKQKIIVSIVGITIVLLALLGITYAYYLTRIQGNTNTNSISITTADLKLVYSENSPEIITENNIMPGTTIGEKKFTVSNTGNSAVEDYKVVLEYAVLEGIVPSVFVRPQDFEITMTCVSKNIQTNEVSGTCSGYTGTWNNESFEMTTNDIAENIKHEYTLTIFYANPDIDQSDDMGKNLNLKVQIYGANETSTITGTIDNVDETYAMKLNSNPKISTIKKITDSEGNVKYQYKFIGVEPNEEGKSHKLTLVNKSNVEQSTGNITIKKGRNANISGSTITVNDNQTNIFLTTGSGSTTLTNTATFNPYSDNTDTLAYHIINNSLNNTNGTELVSTPKTLPAHAASLENERILTYTMDDYGTSYYYRGNVEDNYVNYAGMCWRIVRIEGDGSVKLLLEDRNEQCNDKEGQDLNNNGTYFTGNWSDGNYYAFGYDNNDRADFLNYTGGLADSFKTFQTSKLTTTDMEKLKVDEWCFDDSVTYMDKYCTDYDQDGVDDECKIREVYGAGTRLYPNKKPSLKCTGTKLTEFKDEIDMYVGTLTADEMSFAGATGSTNYNYYLMNTYAKDHDLSWCSLSPDEYNEMGIGDTAYALGSEGNLFANEVYGINPNHRESSRPAVSLKSGSVITGGEGTLEKPYIIG